MGVTETAGTDSRTMSNLDINLASTTRRVREAKRERKKKNWKKKTSATNLSRPPTHTHGRLLCYCHFRGKEAVAATDDDDDDKKNRRCVLMVAVDFLSVNLKFTDLGPL